MSRYRFTAVERYAVIATHGSRCYMCRAPIDIGSFHVDHVIPEQLLRDPETLAQVLYELGLPLGFNLNSFENWLPACAPCNILKSATVWDPSPRIQLELQRASRGADAARACADSRIDRVAVTKAINVLERAAETGRQLTMADVDRLAPLVESHMGASGSHLSEPIWDEALAHLLEDMGLDGDAMVDPEIVREYYFGP